MGPRLAVAQGVGKFQLPEGHLFGMTVPEGGSNCAKCRFVSQDKLSCGNSYFQDWQRSLKAKDPSLLPEPAVQYCCDVFQIPDAQKEARGRNTFYDHPENRERDGIVSHTPHVGYVKKEHGQYCVHSESNPDWSGGCYDTEGEANTRLQQVEFFKHKGASDLVLRVIFRHLDGR
jgi:hypothetical protein